MTRGNSEAPSARRDAVTGLPGREAVHAKLEEWLKAERPVHALLVGLRRLDTVNTAYGQAAGDLALAEIASRIKHFAADELEDAWLVARSGGGTFAVLCAEPCSRERWQMVAGQVLELLARPVMGQGVTMRLSPRAALLRGLSGESADSQLDRLSEALARVMNHPGRRLLWADGEAVRPGHGAARLESDLLRALDDDAIEVVYQPQFTCADDRLIGAEALARWNHPELGRIGAGALFAIAERADHVPQLSRHIARLALRGARRWPMDLRLSLNLTPNDLAVEGFAAEFIALAEAERFALWRLTLEVTEQVLLSDVSHAARTLGELAGRGARIALDDFGAGFCNFRYLKLLPLRTLKLDRSMIDGVVSDPRDLAVLRAIIAMARALELKVVAEGIESEAQRALAAAEGCHAYQGFLRAQPMSGRDFAAFASAGLAA